VLDELGAGDKPRVVALNKVDLLTEAAAAGEGSGVSPIIGGAVPVSATTGFGIDALRTELATVLASLWVDIDVTLPYSNGELLARVRERGTVELEYRERDVRVRGRMAPSLAGEVEAAARRSAEDLAAARGAAGAAPASAAGS
jgi:GTP-binding protein HflX